MNIKKSIIAFVFLGSLGLSAQTSNESEIVISEENLISLIQKIKEKKQQKRITENSINYKNSEFTPSNFSQKNQIMKLIILMTLISCIQN